MNTQRDKPPPPFDGRVIFDHLPKTAGVAVNTWLQSALGAGCVTGNLAGEHRQLIRNFGGLYSVICAHVDFASDKGLDPRWRYATMFRDPVDRAISWLFFATKNHEAAELPELYEKCEIFINSNGEILHDIVKDYISNIYTEHFCRVLGTGQEDDETRLANALAAIELYDVVGLYDHLPDFLADFGALLGVAPPAQLPPVNVTRKRPAVAEISTKLRDRINELNALDLRLYETVQAMVLERLRREDRPHPPEQTLWAAYNRPDIRTITSDDLAIHEVVMATPSPVAKGGVISFAIEFELHKPVARMEAGIHIFDSLGQWAFGVNNTLLKQELCDMPVGRYRLMHHVVADLPVGHFTAGFAFADISNECARQLYWNDAQCEFDVVSQSAVPGVGHSPCRARITVSSQRSPLAPSS